MLPLISSSVKARRIIVLFLDEALLRVGAIDLQRFIRERHPLPLVRSQPQKDRLTKLAIMRPLGKLDPGNQYRFNPLTAFHDCRRNPESPAPACFLR
jgi:hypothetical protein